MDADSIRRVSSELFCVQLREFSPSHLRSLARTLSYRNGVKWGYMSCFVTMLSVWELAFFFKFWYHVYCNKKINLESRSIASNTAARSTNGWTSSSGPRAPWRSWSRTNFTIRPSRRLLRYRNQFSLLTAHQLIKHTGSVSAETSAIGIFKV